jgi:hypothetical protein
MPTSTWRWCVTSHERHASAVPRRGLQPLNRANFGLPVADLSSVNFGRIFSAGPPRLMQFAVKLMF